MSVTSDYIKLTDALALAEELYVGDAPLLAVTYNDIQSLLKAFLRQVPTEDVTEVTRCKDCLFGYRYFDVQNGITDSWVECRNPDGLNRDVSDDGYCCSAIRRKE